MARKGLNHSWVTDIKTRWSSNWKDCFDLIDNQYLKSKVAALVWWDCFKEDENVDWKYVVALHRKYKRTHELEYTENELLEALITVGYPQQAAEIRSQCPKCCRTY